MKKQPQQKSSNFSENLKTKGKKSSQLWTNLKIYLNFSAKMSICRNIENEKKPQQKS